RDIGTRVAQPAVLDVEGLVLAVEPFLAALGDGVGKIGLLHPMGQFVNQDALARRVMDDVDTLLQVDRGTGWEEGTDRARPTAEALLQLAPWQKADLGMLLGHGEAGVSGDGEQEDGDDLRHRHRTIHCALSTFAMSSLVPLLRTISADS